MGLNETITELVGLKSVFEKSRIHYRQFAGDPEQQEDGSWFVSAFKVHSGEQVTAQGSSYEDMAQALRNSVNDYYEWCEG